MNIVDIATGIAIARPSAQTVGVASSTGAIYTIPRLLGSTSIYAVLSSNANLSLNTTSGAVSATAAISPGASQNMTVSEIQADGSGYIRPFTFATAATVPSAPVLSGVPGNTSASLSWVDGSNGGASITSHNIYRNGVLIASPLMPTLSYTDTGLTNGTAYSYQVTAVNSVGEGALSTAVVVTPALSPFASINSDGWRVTYTNTPASTVLLTPFAATRQGFDSTGSATSYTDNLLVARRAREAFPNQLTLEPVICSLSDYLYSTDTVTGATNNSTETSPVPIVQWAQPEGSVVGNTLTVDLVAFHRNGRNSKPVAAVTGTATDGTNTVTASTNTPIVLGDPGDKNSVVGYRLTFDITALTNKATITANAKVYPWIGGSASVANSSTGTAGGRGFVPLRFYKHTAKNAAPPYVYINATTGVDATVDVNGAAAGITKVSTTATVAALAPFATFTSALAALKAATNVTEGFTSGCVMRVHGTVSVNGNAVFGTTYQVTGGELVIEGDPLDSTATLAFGGTNYNTYQPLLRIRNIAFNRTVGSGQFGNSTTGLTLQNVTFNGNSVATALTGVGTFLYVMGATITNPGTNFVMSSSTAGLNLFRGVSCATSGSAEMYTVLGCSFSTLWSRNTGSGRNPTGSIIAYNKFMSISGASVQLQFGAASEVASVGSSAFNNIAIVQNVFEKMDTVNAAMFRPSGDSDVANMDHLVVWNNTWGGGFGVLGRGNILYDENPTVIRTHKRASFRQNIHVQINVKNDWFLGVDGNGTPDPTDAPYHINAWPYYYGVGCRNEWSQFLDALGGAGDGNQIYTGVNTSIGTSATVRNDPLFTNYQGPTSLTVAGAGGGTYSLQSGSPCIGFAATADEVLPYDITGAARSRGAIGAYA